MVAFPASDTISEYKTGLAALVTFLINHSPICGHVSWVIIELGVYRTLEVPVVGHVVRHL